MLHINELTYRIEGRPILDQASVAIATGHKAGLVGRNGAGKSTLLRVIAGELHPEDGNIRTARGVRIGYVQQEAPGGDATLLDWVLDADTERTALLAEAETADDPGRIADIQMRLVDIEAHSAPARAAQILSGLGFDAEAQARPCGAFSGGWRMRVALAAVLFLEPEVLLLDEPTNYLDLEGTLWLESYLKSYPHTVLIVSHDRDLLNSVVDEIVHLDRGRLTLYQGGYDAFEAARSARQALEMKLKRKQDEVRSRMEAFIARFKAKATKAAQARSRMKALERMQPIAAEVDERVVPFSFAAPARALASPLVRLEGASVGYQPGAAILARLDLRIDQDDRIALLGQNGNGKSTFAKLIAGRLAPMSGAMHAHKSLNVGYFAQHQLDDLDPALSPFGYMTRLIPDASEADRRARLGAWGFGVEKADTACKDLSGGEKARLLLGLTTFSRPHLLILDEPTNHLDVDSREELVHALNDYDGAVILISHDRHLIDATVDRLWIVRDGTVASYDGDLAGYRAELLAERGQRARAKRSDADNAAKAGRAEQRRAAAERRSELAPLRREVQAAEKRMEQLSATLGKVDERLAVPTLYTEKPAEAQKLLAERGRVAKDLAEAEQQWLEASESYEAAERAQS